MTFHVTPDDLASFSKQLGRAAEDVSAAKSYMERECSVGTFGAGPVSAIASMFGGGQDGVMENVRAALVKMNEILKASQAEMSRCAEYYRATDRGEASRLDAQYPESKR